MQVVSALIALAGVGAGIGIVASGTVAPPHSPGEGTWGAL